ncbi:bifunctional riboflavin kinase/FAD synthetase [Oleiagrimonas sp. MCCC 1A03011]|uniref:bifunctional riboflavin kinase/FAD synthetase n=1 Tax=Oleiagrimonas sp. MCCC 1A03011 TaxID=1926883 RepID=UPI000DC58456|nr:bifunctional riboflavin kinase/FAD synthetase [Oleiagrimonas sp. MCCC 1A03011]RAP57286.1 riboflavin biosynthesis protein RibF [Oleiagrimonas sp. MCCC 1A03011]
MTEHHRDVAGPCVAPGGSVVTVGAFDGLHRGHRALLARVRERADALGVEAVAISFEPLPRAFFSPEPVPRLASMREKLEGLRDAGMDRVLLLRFNRALTAMPAEQFVRDVLVRRVAAREVWVGGDFRFGHKRGGDFALLERMGAEHGFAARAMPVQQIDGLQVSSSAIRKALADGDFAHAGRLLGRSFAMSGHVVEGEKLGRTLGYPTANVPLGRRVTPLQGIFAVRVDLPDGRSGLPGVASLGVRPTVNRLPQPLLEAHLFDFDEEIYGHRIRVEFVTHLRDEEKFDDLDALVVQMDRDAAAARAALGIAPVEGA